MQTKSTRLPGHELWDRGSAIEGGNSYYEPRLGTGKCSCGKRSPQLTSKAQRKAWHRDHKADLIAGGDGVVWEGVIS